MKAEADIHLNFNSVERSTEPTVALFIWGDVYEDFLDSLGVSLETFCKEIPCGWIIGYIKALRSVGIRTVLIITSAQVTQPSRVIHASTGTVISILPVPKIYRIIRSRMIPPYSLANFGSLEDLFGNVRRYRLLFKLLKHIGPYLSTPLNLLAKELRREGCSVLLCQEYEYSRFDACVLLGLLIRLPVFAIFQGGNYDWNWIGRFLRPLTLRTCRGLIIGTETEIQRVQNRYHIPSDKIAKIFNPIDLEMWNANEQVQARATLNLPIDVQIVVWHGRINIHNKGLDVLLKAWDIVCNKRDDKKLLLLLMGTGLDANQLHQHLADMPRKNILHFNKYVTDRSEIERFLSVGDVYAFPSRHEGFAVAPIEAMACGLPVIATGASGIFDIFENSEESGGVVVSCGDSTAFALELGRLLDDKQLRQEIGKNARRRVEQAFSLNVVGEQLQHILFRK